MHLKIKNYINHYNSKKIIKLQIICKKKFTTGSRRTKITDFQTTMQNLCYAQLSTALFFRVIDGCFHAKPLSCRKSYAIECACGLCTVQNSYNHFVMITYDLAAIKIWLEWFVHDSNKSYRGPLKTNFRPYEWTTQTNKNSHAKLHISNLRDLLTHLVS